ncbi:hypothetical protein PtA15_14A491 [Puccinia triticina]|uniref:Uncharacterized protein n=1 Tax=Puccinia triticina TaxID=208348 RepID=A0ABY7D5Q5_9BASI|nr:uncharacterized protein PtA15_14A491 [Puccinia triticina]WAQ91607.1 hypothetical protein PtA15_14A491 [Puccinia triticina]WAR62414.1 hypothetical protein PtB15_14B509 [Puccinia triticina]
MDPAICSGDWPVLQVIETCKPTAGCASSPPPSCLTSTSSHPPPLLTPDPSARNPHDPAPGNARLPRTLDDHHLFPRSSI